MARQLFEAIYTDEQRDAMATAYEDRRIRPARKVVELAAAGELVPGLAPFTIGAAQTVRSQAAQLRKRRAGEHSSSIALAPPRDAVERLRRALACRIEEELEREQRKPKGSRDVSKLREIGRAIRELAGIPAPRDPAPSAAPGSRDDESGRRSEGSTRTGLGGALLNAHRESGKTAHDDTQHNGTSSESASAGNATRDNDAQ